MIERLPQFAENYFATLCAEAGVVCNGSGQDECGWDFFVQYPSRHRSKKPADSQPAGVEALVQVKSTRREPLIARMKLSNALRAVQATQPYFVVLVVAGTGGGPPRVYARHFWRPEIERTLKRVRLAEHAGNKQFNRRHFDLHMKAYDAHDSDLLDWMRGTIEAVKSYAAEKAEFVKTVGHEDGYGSMTITLEGGADEMLDLQLGLVDSLRVSRARYFSKRFGIEAPHPEFDVEKVQLYVTPVGQPAKLRLQGGSPTSVLTVDAALYHAELPDGAELQHRWRVDAGPLRIVGGGGKQSAKLSMRFDERKLLGDLELFLRMATWRGAGPVALHLFIKHNRVPMGALTLDPGDDDPNWSALLISAQTLQLLVAAAHAGPPEISILELDDAEPYLARFVGFVASSAIRVEYVPASAESPPRAAVYYVGCNVGEWCFLAVIERATRSSNLDSGRQRIDFGPPQLLDAIVTHGRWHDHQHEIEAAYRVQVERLADPSKLWALGELEAFIARVTRNAT
jgi:hypothetical protein